ncbi:MAG: hypothetical protein R3D29_05830 [Nitratireductor sp.]
MLFGGHQGLQLPQLLSTGEFAVAMALNGRILDARNNSAPVAAELRSGTWGNAFVIPWGEEGLSYKDLAMEIINYAISEEAQDRLIPIGAYGPVLKSQRRKQMAEAERFRHIRKT